MTSIKKQLSQTNQLEIYIPESKEEESILLGSLLSALPFPIEDAQKLAGRGGQVFMALMNGEDRRAVIVRHDMRAIAVPGNMEFTL